MEGEKQITEGHCTLIILYTFNFIYSDYMNMPAPINMRFSLN